MMSATAAALLWVAAGYRGFVLYRRRQLVTWAYFVASAAIAAAFTAKIAESAIDRLSPYAGDLVKHLLIVVSCAGVQVLVLGLRANTDSKPSVIRPIIWALIVGTGIIVTFVLAPIHYAQHGLADLDAAHGQLLWVGCNRIFFAGYLSYVLFSNGRLYTRNTATPFALANAAESEQTHAAGLAADADRSPDFGAAVSLRLIGWGSMIGLGYTGSRLIYVVAAVTFHQNLSELDRAGSVIAVISAVFLATGIVAPKFVPWLLHGVNAWRKTPRVNPLWTHLIVTFPGVKVPTKSPWTPSRAEFRYERRLAEIEHCLHGCRLPFGTTTADTDSAKIRIRTVAHELAVHRSTWKTALGPTASQLMPRPLQGREVSAATTHREQVQQLILLAESYHLESAALSVYPALQNEVKATP